MDKTYDILIIGGGLGGLLTGNILSKKGYKVLILEKNTHPGGCLQSFEKDGVVFDTGIHYVGGLDDGQPVNKILKYLDILPHLNIRKLDEKGFDRFIIGDDTFAYPSGYENFTRQLIAYFPDEKKGILQYVEMLKEISASIPLYNLSSEKLDAQIFFEKFSHGKAWDYIQSVTSDTRLQHVLAALNSLYAGKPESSFLFIHALINNHYIEGAWRFVDGSRQLADAFVQKIQEYGGGVLLNKEVKKFQSENGKIKSVLTTNDEKYTANHFISAIHPYYTMEMLEPGLVRKSYRKRVQNIPNTISSFTLYITFEDGKVPYMNSNTYYYPNGNVWGVSYYNSGKFPQGIAIYPVADSIDEKYTRGISVISFMEYDEVTQWENTEIENRGQAYNDFKERKSQAIINKLDHALPGISKHIKSYTSATPLTLKDYTHTYKGSIYGTDHDFRKPYKSLLFPGTKVPNLFLTGQNLSLHGMMGVSMSALLTSAELCDMKELIDDINNA